MSAPPPELAIRELAASAPSREDIDAFLERRPFPLREGPHTTFVYRGRANLVRLGHWLLGAPASRDMERIPGTDLWYLVMDLPPGARVEYRFQRIVGVEADWILDPLNPHTAEDPFGEQSVCHAAGYERPDWTLVDPAAPAGEVVETGARHRLNPMRPVRAYIPANFRESRRYPYLIVHDGRRYLEKAALAAVLDNLIHRHEIPPLIVALVDPDRRILEYANNPEHADFLRNRLVAELEREFRLSNRPDDRGLLGAGLGAVAACTAAARHPGFFGRLMLQSGSFTFSEAAQGTRTRLLDPVVAFVNRFQARPERIANRVFLSCGAYDPLIHENRLFAPVLREAGMEVRFEEALDGHNWEHWRDQLRVGLSWLFPGPIWLHYP